MSEDKAKLDAFIANTDNRVANWSPAQREAFQEATAHIVGSDQIVNEHEQLKGKCLDAFREWRKADRYWAKEPNALRGEKADKAYNRMKDAIDALLSYEEKQ